MNAAGYATVLIAAGEGHLRDALRAMMVSMRAGADRAPLKGEPPARLFAQVEQLLWPSPAHQLAA